MAVLLVFLCFPALSLEVPSAVVDSDWLNDRLGQPGLSVIEVSSEVSFEFDGHIPGAAVTVKGAWRIDDADGVYVRRPVKELQSRIRNLGVNDGDAVVIYGKGLETNDLLGATYLFWVFHFLGHENVALLDESWLGWLAADGEVATEAPKVRNGTFVARPNTALSISTDEVFAVYKTATIVDGRPAGHYSGKTKFPSNSKFGRIPGSLSQPWPEYIGKDMDGLLYMITAMPNLLETEGLKPDEPLILTCFGGTGAAMNFVLFRYYGYKNLRLHDAGIRRWNLRNLPLVKD
ncbi:MAG: sulfurtransferase [Rhodospirillales bacterium]|nr:sulfurtransferase [Alphaproteobacteria bacterium]MBL6947561.1 sulfurtransferase [Rhodospirillales bacterium]